MKAFTRKGGNVDRFEITEEFLLNGQPFKILSGAIHYFRVDLSDWYHSLYNLKALGFN
ncbi:beta-galactosidase, partial [Enterococcus faecalis]|uniref:beta-galactosidase n=1 Tax=Enterococcus faecalis TaxID=1351 RepID=UPI003ED9E7A2